MLKTQCRGREGGHAGSSGWLRLSGLCQKCTVRTGGHLLTHPSDRGSVCSGGRGENSWGVSYNLRKRMYRVCHKESWGTDG